MCISAWSLSSRPYVPSANPAWRSCAQRRRSCASAFRSVAQAATCARRVSSLPLHAAARACLALQRAADSGWACQGAVSDSVTHVQVFAMRRTLGFCSAGA